MSEDTMNWLDLSSLLQKKGEPEFWWWDPRPDVDVVQRLDACGSGACPLLAAAEPKFFEARLFYSEEQWHIVSAGAGGYRRCVTEAPKKKASTVYLWHDRTRFGLAQAAGSGILDCRTDVSGGRVTAFHLLPRKNASGPQP